jgi:hypothetical protein
VLIAAAVLLLLLFLGTRVAVQQSPDSESETSNGAHETVGPQND